MEFSDAQDLSAPKEKTRLTARLVSLLAANGHRAEPRLHLVSSHSINNVPVSTRIRETSHIFLRDSKAPRVGSTLVFLSKKTPPP